MDIGKKDARSLLINAVKKSIKGIKATNMLLSANAAIPHNGATPMQQLKQNRPKFPNANCHSEVGLVNTVKKA